MLPVNEDSKSFIKTSVDFAYHVGFIDFAGRVGFKYVIPFSFL